MLHWQLKGGRRRGRRQGESHGAFRGRSGRRCQEGRYHHELGAADRQAEQIKGRGLHAVRPGAEPGDGGIADQEQLFLRHVDPPLLVVLAKGDFMPGGSNVQLQVQRGLHLKIESSSLQIFQHSGGSLHGATQMQ